MKSRTIEDTCLAQETAWRKGGEEGKQASEKDADKEVRTSNAKHSIFALSALGWT